MIPGDPNIMTALHGVVRHIIRFSAQGLDGAPVPDDAQRALGQRLIDTGTFLRDRADPRAGGNGRSSRSGRGSRR